MGHADCDQGGAELAVSGQIPMSLAVEGVNCQAKVINDVILSSKTLEKAPDRSKNLVNSLHEP
jgi:hypothetical protein